MKLLRTHFEHFFFSLKKDFEKLHRLTQEIIRFLLITNGENVEIISRLIHLIFGKIARKKFIESGMNRELESQRIKLITYIEDYLKKIDEENNLKISIFSEAGLSEKINKKKNLFFFNSTSKSDNNFDIDNEINQFDYLSKKDNKKTEFCDEKNKNVFKNEFILKLEKMRVPQKYVRHYIWLKNFSNSDKKIVSFKELLIQTYLIK